MLLPPRFAAPLLLALSATVAHGQSSDLEGYFGFEALEVLPIGDNAGPLGVHDVDGDGLLDIIVANDHDSRIEVHYQRKNASPDDAERPTRVNELPEHWRFDREHISVTHAVGAILTHDFDRDGRIDLIYSGIPGEIVFLRQSAPRVFELERKQRVKKLSGSRDALAIANMTGDDAPEIVALVDGEIAIFPLDGTDLGAAETLAAGVDLVAMVIDDFDGDGTQDLIAAVPDDPAPVRLWRGRREAGGLALGPQVRFEMSPIVELTSVHLPGHDDAHLVVIERMSKRLVSYELSEEPIRTSGDRDAAIEVNSFRDAGNRQRDHVVVDLDGDGRLDLIATDTEGNALVSYTQAEGRGLQSGRVAPSFADITAIAAGNVDDDPYAECFVLSESEGVVGRVDAGPDGLPFPVPIPLTSGRTPETLALVNLEDGPRVAVVLKESREYWLELVGMTGERTTIELGKLTRSPDAIIDLDADQDGHTDLLLFTRDKPMRMLHAIGDGTFTDLESKDMGQFGLVQAANADNIAVFDVDGDGREELLIADRNFVRAVRYAPEPDAGVSPGWQVVEQLNTSDSSSKLVSLGILDGQVVAADKENDRIVMMQRAADGWKEAFSISVPGFAFEEIHAGSFSGDGEPNLLAVGVDGFGVVRLAGQRTSLRQVAAWRTWDDRRREHELATGDLNSDGFTDLVALDAGEQMCELFSFSETGKLMFATSFQVFESQIFSGGVSREWEPSQAIIADVTGDGANDLLLLAHDRVLLYPQMRIE